MDERIVRSATCLLTGYRASLFDDSHLAGARRRLDFPVDP